MSHFEQSDSNGLTRMAGDWIKWVKGFARKPEIVVMADMLQQPRQFIASAYMEVAEWLDCEGVPDDNTDLDSDITLVLASRSERDKRAQLLSHLDDVARLRGMAEALESVGWLVITPTALVFKRAARHNTETAKRRALAARRQQKSRAKRDVSVSRSNCDKSVTREEKRREEKKGKPPTPFVLEIPDNLKTPEFIEVWESWLTERSKGPASKRITQEGARRQLARLSKMVASGEITAADAADGISEAIEKRWQGPVYEKMGQGIRRHTTGQRADGRVYQ